MFEAYVQWWEWGILGAGVWLAGMLLIVAVFGLVDRRERRERRRAIADAMDDRYQRELREDAVLMGEIAERGDLG